MKIGILGGTFNPPHIGHLILAQTAKDVLRLDKVLFIPTNTPPHKKTRLIDAKKRFKMVKLAVKDCPYFQVLDWEIKRGGISYTIDTLQQLKAEYPGADLFMIIGSDLANTFHTWRDYRKIQALSRVVVARRKSNPLKNSRGFIALDIINIEITSSLVRKIIKKGLSARYLLSKKVFDYIRRNKLYV
ncbi:MAG: nicotinate (nicotinamide) nucleotide adenylyltransferase [Candidatus Omnitrophica bacterium 4484_171]|nr:MAG: nicotinate (nicotinamide) nucleotide adenylyltransferase [Candidatus Omnitrophica bacterium 4484_171]